MKFMLTFLALFVVWIFGLFALIKLDLWLHPWVATIGGDKWYWYHYALSFHAVTVTYMKSWLWLIYPWLIALFWTVGFMLNSGDE